MIFPEAITELEMYKLFADRVKAPILANITEFGATPLYTTEQLAWADVSLVLYPLSAFRAMNKAAENVYTAIRRDGTQQNVIDTMQTRMELYDRIGYHAFEQKLDALFAAKEEKMQPASRYRNAVQDLAAEQIQGRQHGRSKSTQWRRPAWPGGRANRTVHRGPGRCRPDLSRLRRARTGGRREFEEVAYLLLYGELPTKAELAAYKRKLSKLRDLPQALKEVLERIPPTPTRWT
jgi:hypothetical protein